MRCQAWTLTGSALRASKVSPVAAVSSRWKSAVDGARSGAQPGDRRLLAVDRAVEVVDHVAHGADDRGRGRRRPGQQRALIVEAAAQARDGLRARIQPVADLAGPQPGPRWPAVAAECHARWRQSPAGSRAASRCPAGRCRRRGDCCAGTPRRPAARAGACAGCRSPERGSMALASFASRTLSRPVRTTNSRSARARGSASSSAASSTAPRRALACSSASLWFRVSSWPGDGDGTLAVQIDGLLRPVAELPQLVQPQACGIGLEAVGRQPAAAGRARAISRSSLRTSSVKKRARSSTPARRVRRVSASNRAWRSADMRDAGRLEVSARPGRAARPPDRLPAGHVASASRRSALSSSWAAIARPSRAIPTSCCAKAAARPSRGRGLERRAR